MNNNGITKDERSQMPFTKCFYYNTCTFIIAFIIAIGPSSISRNKCSLKNLKTCKKEISKKHEISCFTLERY